MQKIITPGGETMVVLPLDEYERLLDAADIAAAKEVAANIEAGRDELVPAEFIDRLLAGEHPVRVWRTFRGLSAKSLAERAGISAPYLSEIESGKKHGRLMILRKIAEALQIDLDDITNWLEDV